MKTPEIKAGILQMLDSGKEMTAQEIHYKLSNVAIIQVHRTLKLMVDEGTLTKRETEDRKYFQVNVEQEPAQPLKKPRDRSKYKFKGIEYGKGRYVLAVVQDYVAQHNPTYKQLCQAFPQDLVKPYGLFQPESKAKEYSEKRPRFFLKDPVQLKDAMICVSNQITKERVERFLKTTNN